MNRRTRVSRATGLLTGAALLVSGAVLMTAPPAVQEAQAAEGDTIYINDPLQKDGEVGANWDAIGHQGAKGSGLNEAPHVETTSQATGGNGANNGKYNDGRNSSWLTLTDDQTRDGYGSSGTLVNTTPFSSGDGVVLQYDQRIWRTNWGKNEVSKDRGGDGLSVYLLDADVNPSSTVSGASGNGSSIVGNGVTLPGGYGAGLGYSAAAGVDENLWSQSHPNKDWGGQLQQGVPGGYIGVGFDVWGNYANYSTDLGATTGRTRPPLFPDVQNDAEDKSNPIRNGMAGKVDGDRSPNTIGLRGSGVRHDASVFKPVDESGAMGGVRWTNYWYGMNTWGPTETVPTGSGNRWHGGYRWLGGTPLGENDPWNSIESPYQEPNTYRKVRVTIVPGANEKHSVTVEMSDPLYVSDDICVKTGPEGKVLLNADGTPQEADSLSDCDTTGDGFVWISDPAKVNMVERFRHTLGEEIDGWNLQAKMPERFKLGFGASTGYAVDFHQIRNVSASAMADPTIKKSIAPVTSGTAGTFADKITTGKGDQVEYKIELSNNGPTDLEKGFATKMTDGLEGLPLTDFEWKAEVVATGGGFRYATGSDSWSAWYDSGSYPATGWQSGELPDFEWVATAPKDGSGNGVSGTGDVEVVVSIRAKVTDSAVLGTDYTNVAKVIPNTSGGPQDRDLDNNEADATFDIRDTPKWTVEKNSDDAGTVEAGDEVTYTVSAVSAASNAGSPAIPEVPAVPAKTTIYYQKNSSAMTDVYFWGTVNGVAPSGSGIKLEPVATPSFLTGNDWYMVELETAGPLEGVFRSGDTWDNNGGVGHDYQFNKDGSSAWTWSLVGSNSPGTSNSNVPVALTGSYSPAVPAIPGTPEVPGLTVENAYIVDDLSQVLEYATGPLTGATIKIGNEEEKDLPAAGVANCPTTPAELVEQETLCATWPVGANKDFIVGGFTLEGGETAVVTYTVQVKDPIDPGLKWNNLALGGSKTVLPTQCADDGSITLETAATPEGAAPCLVENETSSQTLTLVKRVQNPNGVLSASQKGPGNWALAASGADDYNPFGATGTVPTEAVEDEDGSVIPATVALATKPVPVRAGVELTLSEIVQTADPAYKGSAWACVENDGGETVGSSSAVTVSSGKDVTCAITNSTAELTLLKKVEGGAEASAFKLTAASPGKPGLAAVDGSIQPNDTLGATTALVTPDEEYTLSEAPVGGYMQKALQIYEPAGATCPAISETASMTEEDWKTVWNTQSCWTTVKTGTDGAEKGQLKVTPAAGSSAIYRFVNVEANGPTLPLTGGASAFLIFAISAGLLGIAATAEVLRRKKRGSGAHVA